MKIKLCIYHNYETTGDRIFTLSRCGAAILFFFHLREACQRSWEKFEDSYKVMVFANGDKCWNGPDRSLKVRLKCGLKNEVADVDEPSRCEYVALLSTPALCLEEKLQELQHKLELLNKEQPQGHDEL
ncbi:hypothetical protein Pyn_09972 [Prunus yedoensis var. nudiflora]|uniref:MRH domain-containing protein n=1 Tax=Prunus yedoensis var. nudiflora TaxID=2094558 RepID=A0A314XIP8_PRUYE|nr:hypothetical protein Pyn_09972 [Prunus yedoensis var. nudiflora]